MWVRCHHFHSSAFSGLLSHREASGVSRLTVTFPRDTRCDTVMLSALLAAQVTAGGTSLLQVSWAFSTCGDQPRTQAPLGWHPAGPTPRCSPCTRCRPPAARHPAVMAAPAPCPAHRREGPWERGCSAAGEGRPSSSRLPSLHLSLRFSAARCLPLLQKRYLLFILLKQFVPSKQPDRLPKATGSPVVLQQASWWLSGDQDFS